MVIGYCCAQRTENHLPERLRGYWESEKIISLRQFRIEQDPSIVDSVLLSSSTILLIHTFLPFTISLASASRQSLTAREIPGGVGRVFPVQVGPPPNSDAGHINKANGLRRFGRGPLAAMRKTLERVLIWFIWLFYLSSGSSRSCATFSHFRRHYRTEMQNGRWWQQMQSQA